VPSSLGRCVAGVAVNGFWDRLQRRGAEDTQVGEFFGFLCALWVSVVRFWGTESTTLGELLPTGCSGRCSDPEGADRRSDGKPFGSEARKILGKTLLAGLAVAKGCACWGALEPGHYCVLVRWLEALEWLLDLELGLVWSSPGAQLWGLAG